MTLNELIKEHPEWADLPIGVLRDDGDIDYIGDSGMVYDTEGEDLDGNSTETVLVFTGN